MNREDVDDPCRVVVLSGVDAIRWRRPPVADLPPATIWQAFSLQRGGVVAYLCSATNGPQHCSQSSGTPASHLASDEEDAPAPPTRGGATPFRASVVVQRFVIRLVR